MAKQADVIDLVYKASHDLARLHVIIIRFCCCYVKLINCSFILFCYCISVGR